MRRALARLCLAGMLSIGSAGDANAGIGAFLDWLQEMSGPGKWIGAGIDITLFCYGKAVFPQRDLLTGELVSDGFGHVKAWPLPESGGGSGRTLGTPNAQPEEKTVRLNRTSCDRIADRSPLSGRRYVIVGREAKTVAGLLQQLAREDGHAFTYRQLSAEAQPTVLIDDTPLCPDALPCFRVGTSAVGEPRLELQREKESNLTSQDVRHADDVVRVTVVDQDGAQQKLGRVGELVDVGSRSVPLIAIEQGPSVDLHRRLLKIGAMWHLWTTNGIPDGFTFVKNRPDWLFLNQVTGHASVSINDALDVGAGAGAVFFGRQRAKFAIQALAGVNLKLLKRHAIHNSLSGEGHAKKSRAMHLSVGLTFVPGRTTSEDFGAQGGWRSEHGFELLPTAVLTVDFSQLGARRRTTVY